MFIAAAVRESIADHILLNRAVFRSETEIQMYLQVDCNELAIEFPSDVFKLSKYYVCLYRYHHSDKAIC